MWGYDTTVPWSKNDPDSRSGIAMPIKILEIHHHAVRIGADAQSCDAVHDFYTNVLGLSHDESRPDFPGVPGWWINVGNGGQIHLIGGALPSPFAKEPGQDPTAAHVALAVESIVEAKSELVRSGVPHWSLVGVTGPESEQIFVHDPAGNMIELHQFDKCRCPSANRRASGR
jgi:catechol 2,3-dioxygenase-like lactoylglutathione lyase family enzyme